MDKKKSAYQKSLMISLLVVILLLLPMAVVIIVSFVMQGNPQQLGNFFAKGAIWFLIYFVVVCVLGVLRLVRHFKSIGVSSQEVADNLEILAKGGFELVRSDGMQDSTGMGQSLGHFSELLKDLKDDLLRVLGQMADGDMTAEFKVPFYWGLGTDSDCG